MFRNKFCTLSVLATLCYIKNKFSRYSYYSRFSYFTTKRSSSINKMVSTNYYLNSSYFMSYYIMFCFVIWLEQTYFCNSYCEKWFPIAFFNFRGAAPPRPRIRHRSETLSYELSLCLINSPVLNIDPPKSQLSF